MNTKRLRSAIAVATKKPLKKFIFVLPLLVVPLQSTPASTTSTVSQIAQVSRCNNVEIRATTGNRDYRRGQSWRTCTGSGYQFIFQHDGNVVLYTPSGRAIWATGTDRTSADILSVQADGNVVLYDQGRAVWATNTAGNRGALFAIQNDGNVVVYTSSGRPIFATSTDGGQSRTLTAARDWSGGANQNSSPRPTFPLEGYNSIGNNCRFGQSCTGNNGNHSGVDYMTNAGATVKSICDGVVKYSQPSTTDIWNRFTIIEHKNCGGRNTVFAYYGHIDSQVKAGSQISRGQVIGTVANWGNNSHLHFGLATQWFNSGWGYPPNVQGRSGLENSGWIDPESFFGNTSNPVSGFKTYFVGDYALNTNNYFSRIDGFPIMSSWRRNDSHPDQQFERLQGNWGTLLKHKSTGGCLNAHYLYNGAQMNVWIPCSASDPDQNWNIDDLGGGYFQIKRANTNLCVDMPNRNDSGRIHLWQCDRYNPNQRWRTN